MKKLLILAVLALALVVTAVACSGDNTPADTTADTTANTEAATDADTEAVADTAVDSTENTTASTEAGTATDTSIDDTTADTTVDTTDESDGEVDCTTEAETLAETEVETESETVDDSTYVVDLKTVTITGSYPQAWNGSQLSMNPAMTADDALAVMHYGSIDLGEMDLSQYSKVIISYGTAVDLDGTTSMLDQYNATAKRVMLLNTASAVQPNTAFEYLPEEDAIIASTTYEMSASNLLVTTVEIDLSSVDYNGQTYLTLDFRNANNEFGATTYLVVITGIVFSK